MEDATIEEEVLDYEEAPQADDAEPMEDGKDGQESKENASSEAADAAAQDEMAEDPANLEEQQEQDKDEQKEDADVQNADEQNDAAMAEGEGDQEQDDVAVAEDQAEQKDAAEDAAEKAPEADGMETQDGPEGEDAEKPPAADDSEQANNQAHVSSLLDGALEDPLKMPPHGTEVFLGGVPREATDDEIKAFCEQTGPVFLLKVPKDPTNQSQNKGFAFVTYKTKEAAKQATQQLNQTEFPKSTGRRVKVQFSQAKNRLFIGNVPKDLGKDDFTNSLKDKCVGIDEVELMMQPEGTQNRGFGFITFYNHACAEQARKHLTTTGFTLQDRHLTITWAEPKRSEMQEAERSREQVKSVYIGNLPVSVTEAKLKTIFQKYGEVEKVVLPPSKDDPSRPFREFGFVHYKERACALSAIDATETDKPSLDGNVLSVHLAKPQTPQSDMRQNTQGGGYGRNPAGGYAAAGYAGGGYAAGGYGAGGYGAGYDAGYGRQPPVPRPMAQRGRDGSARPGGAGYGGAPAGSRRYSGPYHDYAAGYDYDEGYDDYDYGRGGYSGYGGYGGAGGGNLVPVVLPNGQVGYVLGGATSSPSSAGGYAAYEGRSGAARSSSGGYSRSRGEQRAERGYGDSYGYESRSSSGYEGRSGRTSGSGGGGGGSGSGYYSSRGAERESSRSSSRYRPY